jgi:protein-tyrosine-phosphatase
LAGKIRKKWHFYQKTLIIIKKATQMNIENIAYQPELVQSLPEICNLKDYTEYRNLLERMDEIIKIGGLDLNFALQYLVDLEAKRKKNGKKKLKPKQRRKAIAQAIQAFRCMMIKILTGKSYRDLSITLADSMLLQHFCQISRIDNELQVPSKSQLQRYNQLFPESMIRKQIVELNHQVTENSIKFKLQDPFTAQDVFIDSTCMKAKIHFPVDWLLLKDCSLTIIQAIIVLRNHGLRCRIKSPKKFISEINALCMSMTSASKKRQGGKKEQKKILRKLRDLSKIIMKHGERYTALLQTHREAKTDLSEMQADCILERISKMQAFLPIAIEQASSRILKGTLLKNCDKLLTVYHSDVNVIKRGKAGGQVEFGNSLFLAEQKDGIILDWKLYKTDVKDPQATKESIVRMTDELEYEIASLTGDRGCQSKTNDKLLKQKNIYSGLCPRNPHEFIEKMKDDKFSKLQKRRAQTEGRIGIFKNVILDGSLYEKDFSGKESKIAWAVLIHNIWCMARLPLALPDKQELDNAA